MSQKLVTRFFGHSDGRRVVLSYPDLPQSSDRSVYLRSDGERTAREFRYASPVMAVNRAMSKMRTLWAQGFRPQTAEGVPRTSAAGDRPRVTWFSERIANNRSTVLVDVLTTRPEQFIQHAVPDWFLSFNVATTTEPRRIARIDFQPRRRGDGPDEYRVRLELVGPLAPAAAFADLLDRLRARIAGESNPDWTEIWGELRTASDVSAATARTAFQQLQTAYRDRLNEDERQRRIRERAERIAAEDAARTVRTEAAVRAEVERIRTERDFGTTQRRINLDD